MSTDPNNQPMQDPDRTVLVPSPGGRRAPAGAAPGPAPGPAPAAPRPAPAADGSIPQLHGEGLNPLVHAANPLLDLVTPLRAMVAHPDVEGLRMQLVHAVKAFEASAKAAHVPHDQIAAARYALCTLLDETISSTPWGGGGVWASRSLLVAFHNEAFGGEKFFLILQKLTQDPKTNRDALELMYLCLALGLEGRYRVIDNGRSQLDALRERLLQLISQQHAPVEAELSPHWKGETGKGERLWRMVPVWIMAAAAALILVVLQLFLAHGLGGKSDPVFASLLSMKTAQPPVVAPPAPAPPRLAKFLAPEIAQGLVSVVDAPDRSVVTLRGDGVFASGSGDVDSAFVPLMNRIGDALRAVPGKVVVVGHTDNTRPGLSARYPSNYELSKARASSVRDLLAVRASPPERYSVEGQGDATPVAPNDTPANRARNRRVEIILLTPATDQ